MRVVMVVLCAVMVVAGLGVGADTAGDDPGFVRWLVVEDPGDETIRNYWERAERNELDAPSLVDLGTMVFYRGFADDALELYHRALDADPELYEAWFRIGLVEHSRGELGNAEQAYRRCLKRRPGHAWCNFYYGLLEEQLGHTTKALEHYEDAFKSVPELADPRINPEVMSSRLALGARLRYYDRERFEQTLPMRFLRPNKVRQIRQSYEPAPEETRVPTAEAEPAEAAEASTASDQPTPVATSPPPRPAPPARRVPTRPPSTPQTSGSSENSAAGETPYGAPLVPIGDTSGEARLVPSWPGLQRVVEALI